MTSVTKGFMFALLSGALGAGPTWAAGGTYTAASCNQSAVNSVINGPTHTAVDGDIIIIPAGSCSWSSGITVPTQIGIQIIGGGASATPTSTPSTSLPDSSCMTTVITETATGFALFSITPSYGNSLSRISCMELVPPSSPTTSPVIVNGTCASGGCPSFRLDNMTIPGRWSSGSVPDATYCVAVNVFGAADHNNVGSDGVQTGNGVVLINFAYPSWKGVGSYGDNSWASPSTWGTNQEFYVENNTFTNAMGTDSDTVVGTGGGGRMVCRFNTFTGVTSGDACTNHGTETTGRPRGGRQMEAYGNSLSCSNSSQGCVGFGMRSGPGYIFGNTYAVTGGGFWSGALTKFTTERTYRPTPWTICDGVGVWDVNDGGTVYYTGQIATITGSTLTVSETPWTANAYVFSVTSPHSVYYTVYDTTTGAQAGIANNTASSLTLSWQLSNISSAGSFNSGDSFIIYGATLYGAGSMTGASDNLSVLTDSSKSWTTNEWKGYNVLDVSQGYAGQIASNTSTTLTFNIVPSNYTGSSWGGWKSGDAYAILRETQCLDPGGNYSAGTLLSGTVPSPVPSPQTTDRSYIFMQSGGSVPGTMASGQDLHILANRDFYTESPNQAAQSSTSLPFNGASGMGHGTLANRPSTCTPNVGYWAVDQGNWNQSENGFGQGELFVCTAPNTWTLKYTPYTYPHPLTSAATTGTGGLQPPTDLEVVSQ